MAGTRTAPVVSGASTMNTATLHAIDASGDLYTDSITTVAPLSDIAMEAWIAAYQAATQASVYKVTNSIIWEGDADPANAEALYRGSVKDGINLLYKNLTTLKAATPRLVAPVAATMDGNLDIPDIDSALLVALDAAIAALLTGYDLQSAQFTERRERSNNPRIKA